MRKQFMHQFLGTPHAALCLLGVAVYLLVNAGGDCRAERVGAGLVQERLHGGRGLDQVAVIADQDTAGSIAAAGAVQVEFTSQSGESFQQRSGGLPQRIALCQSGFECGVLRPQFIQFPAGTRGIQAMTDVHAGNAQNPADQHGDESRHSGELPVVVLLFVIGGLLAACLWQLREIRYALALLPSRMFAVAQATDIRRKTGRIPAMSYDWYQPFYLIERIRNWHRNRKARKTEAAAAAETAAPEKP